MRNNTLLLSSLSLAGLALSTSSFAFEREHDAHEHGHATLSIVVEKNNLSLSFHSPAMNIVGFEHPAESKDDTARLKFAVRQLQNADVLFEFNSKAACVLKSVSIESGLLNHDGDEKDKHSEPKDEAHGEEVHSEFEAEYHFECGQLKRLKTIDTELFKAFPSMEEIEVKIVGDKGQKLIELDARNTKVSF